MYVLVCVCLSVCVLVIVLVCVCVCVCTCYCEYGCVQLRNAIDTASLNHRYSIDNDAMVTLAASLLPVKWLHITIDVSV